MCGINGIVASTPEIEITAQQIEHMRDILTYRGPDDAGIYLSGGVGLGSRRLAILDLSPRGHMPMSSRDGRYWIVYNGEIYNFLQLRRELDRQGVRFHSRTDTEVLLELFIQYGVDMLEQLNGMFALAIWDQQERMLFLARDRMGIKPLYYAVQQDHFYFASEAKAIFAAGITPVFDQSCWEELLCFRYIAGERTIYEGVKRLLPGHYLILQDGQAHIQRWWNLTEKVAERRASIPADVSEWYAEVFDDAIRLRLISDVPLGVLLSGGLDSSSVAASLAVQAGGGINAFTVRFKAPGYDEGSISRQMIEQYRLTGNELYVQPEGLLEELRQAAWHNDEPLVHSSDAHLMAIARYARPRVTVLLSGEGADETLGGYIRYQPLRFPTLLALGKTPLGRLALSGGDGRLGKLGQFLRLGENSRLILYNACDVFPEDLIEIGIIPTGRFDYREAVLMEAQSIYPRELARQAMYSDQRTFLCSLLDRNDRMTMAASIECRVPFLDYRLVEMTAALPSHRIFCGLQTKPLLRKSMAGRLPDAVKRHRKWGFGVPWKTYFRANLVLREQIGAVGQSELLRNSPLNMKAVRRTIQQFLDGDDRSAALAQQLFMIALSWDTLQQGLREYHHSQEMAYQGGER